MTIEADIRTENPSACIPGRTRVINLSDIIFLTIVKANFIIYIGQ